MNSLKPFLVACAPMVFVLLWSTGFIGAAMSMPYSEPFTFLGLRFLLTLALLLGLALILKARLIMGPRQMGHVGVVGILVHGIYLGGVFFAVERGMPAALSALIVGLQPLITAAMAGPLLGETVTRRQVAGLLLGLLGVALVLGVKLAPAGAATLFEGFDIWAVLACVAALLGITFGLVYQKRFCGRVDLVGGAVVQYAVAALACGAVALLFEDNRIAWTGEFIFALAWLVLVLSIGAVSLLMLLVRWGEAARTASLFYLVPPATAVTAYLLFGDRLTLVQLLGMALAAAGVALVVARQGPAGNAAVRAKT
jgi:drug/metabolite transporter (DMT)-like permease